MMSNKGGCLGCKHLSIDEGGALSEVTFEEMTVYCKGGIDTPSLMIGSGNQEEWYQKIIVDGSTCDKYKQGGWVS